MSDHSAIPKPTIFFDQTLAFRYGKLVAEMDCDGQGLPLLQKGVHFLLPPNLAIYCWNPNADVKTVYGQLQQFRRTFPVRLIIVEGTPDADHAQTFCGLQMRFWLEGFDVMQPSGDPRDTVMILKSLATRLQIKDHPPTLSRSKPKADLKTLHRNLVEGLIGTGPQKAEILLDHLGSAVAIVDAIIHHPAKILEIKGFGPEFVAANKTLLCKKS